MGKLSLRAARVNKGLIQKEAAKRLQVSNKTLSHWENGVSFPNPLQIDAICNLYDVNYDDLSFLPANPL